MSGHSSSEPMGDVDTVHYQGEWPFRSCNLSPRNMNWYPHPPFSRSFEDGSSETNAAVYIQVVGQSGGLVKMDQCPHVLHYWGAGQQRSKHWKIIAMVPMLYTADYYLERLGKS